MLDRLSIEFEIKALDDDERIIEGYASVFGNVDGQGDVIAPSAFDRTLKANPDVLVFIGHNAADIPVGQPVEIRPDGKGLYTRTYIYPTPRGDEILGYARRRLANGKTLGMSIGYRTLKSEPERDQGGRPARKLLDVELIEYSFLAAPQLAANRQAQVVAVKADEEQDDKDEHNQIGETADELMQMAAELEQFADSDEAKAGRRMSAAMRERLSQVRQTLDELERWADYDDSDGEGDKSAGGKGGPLSEREVYRLQLEAMEVIR